MEGGREIGMYAVLFLCSANLCVFVGTAHMVFGLDLDVGNEDNSHFYQLQAAAKEFINSILKAASSGVWLDLHFPTPHFRRFKRSMDDLMEIPKVYLDQSQQRIKKAVEKGEWYQGQCFLEQLLIEKKLTEKEIILISSLLVGIALDTVSFKSAMWLLSREMWKYLSLSHLCCDIQGLLWDQY